MERLGSPRQGTVASGVLACLRRAFDVGASALAGHCLDAGRLSSRKLDAQQVASFELAWAGVDLLAAETSVAALRADASELQTALAMLFAVEAVGSVLSRLETIYLELHLDLAPLRAIGQGVQWEELRRSTAGSAALEAAGRAVALADGEVGPVALDEPHALGAGHLSPILCRGGGSAGRSHPP